MKNLLTMFALISLAIFAFACTPAEETPVTEETAVDTTTTEETPAETQDLEMVEVSAEGTEFDPAVEIEQLPDGVWYCDMGTVHYARAEEGDGTCPLCEMQLVYKEAAPAATADEDTSDDVGSDEHSVEG